MASKGYLDGTVRPLRAVSGAVAVREVYADRMNVPEHDHQCVALTVPIVGRFVARSDVGESRIEGASAVLHPPRSHHSAVCGAGLEAIGIHFDIAWIRCAGFDGPLDQTRYWNGGKAGALARRLARTWLNPNKSDVDLAAATAFFFRAAFAAPPPPAPAWLGHVEACIADGAPVNVGVLARRLDLHPAWLAQAYRAAKGEGIRESARRKSVEVALDFLRNSNHSLAGIAVVAGFCDQSHMNRAFRQFLGRTPLEMRVLAHQSAGQPG